MVSLSLLVQFFHFTSKYIKSTHTQRHTATAQGSHKWSHVKHTRKQPATNDARTRVVSISVRVKMRTSTRISSDSGLHARRTAHSLRVRRVRGSLRQSCSSIWRSPTLLQTRSWEGSAACSCSMTSAKFSGSGISRATPPLAPAPARLPSRCPCPGMPLEIDVCDALARAWGATLLCAGGMRLHFVWPQR